MSDFIKNNAEMLKKVVRVSGLLGAGAIFGASFVNDHFVTALQEDTQVLESIESDESVARTAIQGGADQLAAEQRIIEMENTLNSLTNKSPKEELESLIESSSSYINTFDECIEGLGENINDLKDATKKATLDDATKKAIEDIDTKVKTLGGKVKIEADAFEKIKTEFEKSEGEKKVQLDSTEVNKDSAQIKRVSQVLQDDEKDEQEDKDEKKDEKKADVGAKEVDKAEANGGALDLEKVDEQVLAVMEKFDELDNEYSAIGEQIDATFDKIEEQVTKEREKSESTAGLVEYIASAIAALGAGLATAGNWLGGKLGLPPTDDAEG